MLGAITLDEPFQAVTGNIVGIPTAITHNHNEVFHYWQKSGLENAVLVHIDNHADMMTPPTMNDSRLNYFNFLDIAEFICAGFHYDIVSSAYWLDPYSEDRRLQYFGAKDDPDRTLTTMVEKTEVTYPRGNEWIVWSDYQDEIKRCKGQVISPEQIQLPENKPFILDIDLDAFCCEARGDLDNYKTRIGETIEFLRELGRRPDLITITQSSGISIDPGEYILQFVPDDYIASVYKELVTQLNELYTEMI
jgi:hypothetical protein